MLARLAARTELAFDRTLRFTRDRGLASISTGSLLVPQFERQTPYANVQPIIRCPARSSMKRKADDDPGFDNVRPIKTEKDGNTDYSQDVKKKINASARTGQACDRCRVSEICRLCAMNSQSLILLL